MRLAVPAFAGGILYMLGGIISASVANSAPAVGPLQGLQPTLSGEAHPAMSPRTAEVKYDSHHALPLIAGSVIAAIAIAALTLVLLLLADATRFRRPNSWAAARPLAILGGVFLALASIAHQVILAIQTHEFAVGHDFSNRAADHALTTGTAIVIPEYFALIGGVALAAGMIAIVLNALRVGLIARWVGVLGIFTGILIFVPLGGATLGVIPAFWLVAMGILYIGKWPNGQPPAWETGEARPWPSRAQMRAEASGGKGQPALATGAGDVTPAPKRPAVGSSRRRRRKGRGGG